MGIKKQEFINTIEKVIRSHKEQRRLSTKKAGSKKNETKSSNYF